MLNESLKGKSKYLKIAIFIVVFGVLIFGTVDLLFAHFKKEARKSEEFVEVWKFYRYDDNTGKIEDIGSYDVSYHPDEAKSDDTIKEGYVLIEGHNIALNGDSVYDKHLEFCEFMSCVYIYDESSVSYVGISPYNIEYDNLIPEYIFTSKSVAPNKP